METPAINVIVRCRIPLYCGPDGTTGRIAAIVSEDDGPVVVIESFWGSEITVSVKDYPYFFESADRPAADMATAGSSAVTAALAAPCVKAQVACN